MDIVGPEDLSMKISQLREITDWKVPIMVKFTSGRVSDDVKIAAKAGADAIVVDGMQGGTGAGPDVVTEHSGVPTIAAIVEADEALKQINLREKVSLIAAGGIRNGADVAKAIAWERCLLHCHQRPGKYRLPCLPDVLCWNLQKRNSHPEPTTQT
jgi:glutamate synthase domain-containing protein 2